MTTRIVRVENTLSVEIPEDLIAQTSLSVGEPVEWVSNGSGGIMLVKSSAQPPATPPTRMTLEQLLEGLEEGDNLGEYDWGRPSGAEVW